MERTDVHNPQETETLVASISWFARDICETVFDIVETN